MYRQPESNLNAVFRDTSGHRFSVILQLMFATISFLGLTLLHDVFPEVLIIIGHRTLLGNQAI